MSLFSGIGLGWRPETALLIERRPGLAFSEVLAENLDPADLPRALEVLRARGLPIVPHGVGLSLGGAELPEPEHLDRLCRLAERLNAPFVSEHVAFVRVGELDSGHLLPVARTHESLELLIENVRVVQRTLPVPLVLENIATLFEWPEAELSEPEFLRKLLEATNTRWLFDISNLHANVRNHGWNLEQYLAEAPLDRIAYAHVAGGTECAGLYHDTHAHPLQAGPLATLAAVLAQTGPLPLLLERDQNFGERLDLEAELDDIELANHAAAAAPGARTETSFHAA